MDVRTCPNGHPVSVAEERCRVCGSAIEQAGLADVEPAGAVGDRTGWPHIFLGLAIGVLGALAILLGHGESHAMQILGGAVCVVATVLVLIGVVAEGIRVSRGRGGGDGA